MATIKQIRQRIKTSKNIQQITRAMKLVAAARLKKAQEKAVDARPYSDLLRQLMMAISDGRDVPYHPLLEKRESSSDKSNYALLLITAERGLAGSYNTNLLRTAHNFIKERGGNPKILCVGKKGAQYFVKQGYDVIYQHTIASSGVKINDAHSMTELLREKYERHEFDEVFVCYSKFYSAIRQVPQIVQLLPIIKPVQTDIALKNAVSKNYLFEPNAKELLNILLPKYLFTLVFQTLLESNASEHGSRMTAMTSATDNAKKVIERLTLSANRERQAAITKEILEVVSGAEALSR